MNWIDRILYNPRGGQVREYEGVTTQLEPQDVSLYGRLLPHPLTMPDQPIVTLYVVDFIRVAPSIVPRYQEWAVLLTCAFNGVEGFYSLTMPVTNWMPMMGGRYLGFPKYVVDEIRLRHEGDAVIAWGKHKGVRQIDLEYHPGVTRRLASWERAWMDDPAFFKGPQAYQLVPPGKGPRVLKITIDYLVEPHWSPCPGMIKVQVDPHENWAGLVPAMSVFPGTFNHFVGRANFAWTSMRAGE